MTAAASSASLSTSRLLTTTTTATVTSATSRILVTTSTTADSDRGGFGSEESKNSVLDADDTKKLHFRDDDGDDYAAEGRFQQLQQQQQSPAVAAAVVDYALPKCEFPPPAEYQPIEAFVAKAVADQHAKNTAAAEAWSKKTTSTSASAAALPFAINKTYRGILDALRKKNDPFMVRCLLLALRTGESGSTLYRITSCSSLHAQLLHSVVKLDPYEVVDVQRQQQGEDATTFASPSPMSYDVVDAHFHLLLALVSSNSVFLVPVLTSLWKMLAALSRYENNDDDDNNNDSGVSSER